MEPETTPETATEEQIAPVAPPTSGPKSSTRKEEVVDDTPAIEKEFRPLIAELIEAGVDPADMMTDPRLEDVNERALAQDFRNLASIHANGKLMRGFKDRDWLGIVWRSVYTADRCKPTALGFAILWRPATRRTTSC